MVTNLCDDFSKECSINQTESISLLPKRTFDIRMECKSFNNCRELEQIVHRLEQGTVLTRFDRKGFKIQRKHFSVRLDTRQLIWHSKPINGSICQNSSSMTGGVIDLREIKEIRIGWANVFDRILNGGSNTINSIGDQSSSKEKGPNGTQSLTLKLDKWERSQCFTLYYGTAFNLKTLTCSGIE